MIVVDGVAHLETCRINEPEVTTHLLLCQMGWRRVDFDNMPSAEGVITCLWCASP